MKNKLGFTLCHLIHTVDNQLLFPAGTEFSKENLNSLLRLRDGLSYPREPLLWHGSVENDIRGFLEIIFIDFSCVYFPVFSAFRVQVVRNHSRGAPIAGAFILTGVSILCLYFVGEPEPIGLLFWVLASVGGVTIDVLGNIPFMRMVKPRERTEMTMIFSTWREASQLTAPLLVSLVLLWAPFEVFYLVLALLLFSASIAASFLSRRL